MRLSLTDSEAEVREETRAFLAEHLPESATIPTAFDERITWLRAWQARLHQAGLVGADWPREHGGRGASPVSQLVINRELARAGAPAAVGSVGIDVVGPSIVAHGTDAQKARHLDRILAGDDIWCQGFSETNAGSDLAAITTRGDDHGDHFVVNGHKIWTSLATHAQWCAVLARTDPDSSRHRGISYLLVDMSSPGIEVRPLVQTTGDPEFGEVYFTDVVVPRENLLGELHGGWAIAMHTLTHERGWYGLGRQVILRVMLDRLVEEARSARRGNRAAIDVPEVRTALARAHVGLEVLRHQGYHSVGHALATGHAGLESSIDKVVLGQVEQTLAAAALAVLGPHTALVDGAPDGVDADAWHHLYLFARAASVYGGSTQIQLNIIAERILGLPRSA